MVSTVISPPISRPLLPRASSAMSGFFFCGMIDDPVANASSSSTQPNSGVAQSTISSPNRDRGTPTSAATKRNPATKSPSETAPLQLGPADSQPTSFGA